jgi:hypothetical protein
LDTGFLIDPFTKTVTSVPPGFESFRAAIGAERVDYSTLWTGGDGLSSIGVLMDDSGLMKPKQSFFALKFPRRSGGYDIYPGKCVLILDGEIPKSLAKHFGSAEAVRNAVTFVTAEVALSHYLKRFDENALAKSRIEMVHHGKIVDR